jgi:acyl-CoA synthetase (AMP-forming)/AMP-acid ligase II
MMLIAFSLDVRARFRLHGMRMNQEQRTPTMSTTRRNSTGNDAALAAFITRKAEIDAMLERLAAFSDDHFGVAPEDVHWGHLWTAPAMQGVFFCAVTS